MGTIVGLICNNEAIIASDTLLSNDNGKENTGELIGNIISYNLSPEVFHVGFNGTYEDVEKFNTILNATTFVGTHISAGIFASTCYKILKQQSLSNLTLLIAAFDKKPSLHLISAKGLEEQELENSYLLVLPRSFSKQECQLMDNLFATIETFLCREDAMVFLRKVVEKIGALDGYKTVNKEIHFSYISKEDSFIAAGDYKDDVRRDN